MNIAVLVDALEEFASVDATLSHAIVSFLGGLKVLMTDFSLPVVVVVREACNPSTFFAELLTASFDSFLAFAASVLSFFKHFFAL